jgi:hypothetical protein
MRKRPPQGWTLAGLQIKFLIDLFFLSVLTEEQVKRYVLTGNDMKGIIDFALRDGYVTKITNIEDLSVSYCCSSKGLQIFSTPSCRDFISSHGFKLPENKISADTLKNHQGFILSMVRVTISCFFAWINEKMAIFLCRREKFF